MRTFACHHCRQLVFFENSFCLNCGSLLAFDGAARELWTYDASVPEPPRCETFETTGCNWLPHADGELCPACLLTRTRPSDLDPDGMRLFRLAETAKRRLLFELGELRLPLPSWRQRDGGLAFDLLVATDDEPVTTGHLDGVVTLDLAEADDAHRARVREQMHEPYRTLLGHLRHEIGHFYYPLLTEDDVSLQRVRDCLGDERADYQEALDRHYREGAPADWPDRFVSSYATMHPSEDWAETFAHLLHIRDTVQTATAYRVHVEGPATPGVTDGLAFEPVAAHESIDDVLRGWLPLTYALNAINRSMGQDDLYPFVIPPPVVDKLRLIDELVASG